MSHRISSFLPCAKIMGKSLNRGAGMGLEVPCMYKFAGQESSIESMRTEYIRKQCDYMVND